MSHTISNPSGDRNDKIANAAKLFERAAGLKSIFIAIYTGKKKFKTVKELEKLTGLNNVRVLQYGKKLFAEDIVKMDKNDGGTYYEKIDFYTHNRSKILQLAKNKEKLKKFPTKINPQIQGAIFKIPVPKKLVNVKQITIDDIESFKKIKKIKGTPKISSPFAEKKIKSGFQKIIGEPGSFTDWGGELGDLFSTRIYLNGSRKSVAFAFKGKATKGILTPKKLGKNADQIQRLFRSSAEIFLIQYQGEIDQSVLEQMKAFATLKSALGDKIYYGIIDGQDTARLMQAYPNQFK